MANLTDEQKNQRIAAHAVKLGIKDITKTPKAKLMVLYRGILSPGLTEKQADAKIVAAAVKLKIKDITKSNRATLLALGRALYPDAPKASPFVYHPQTHHILTPPEDYQLQHRTYFHPLIGPDFYKEG